MELKADNGLIYQKDSDGWTVVASCITGTPQDADLAQKLVMAVEACKAARFAMGYGPDVLLSSEELAALELIGKVLE